MKHVPDRQVAAAGAAAAGLSHDGGGNTYFAKVGKLFIIAFLGSLELSCCCSVVKWLMFEVERPVNGRFSGCFCYLAGESLRFLLNSPKKLFSLVTFFLLLRAWFSF